MPAGIGAVCDETVDELAHPIHKASHRQDNAESAVFYAIFSTQDRHSEREILPHKIEHGIAYHRTEDHPPLPIVETLFCLHSRI